MSSLRTRTDTYRRCPNKQAQVRKDSADICFTCHELGHWSKDCPTKTQPVRPQSNDLDLPVVQCPHGHGACAVRTCATEKNRNRKYYDCPRKRSVTLTGTGGCDFFAWCDSVPLPDAVPMCPCGAGRCSVRRETVGPDAGRWSFSCRVQKGHGACSFFQWEGTKTNWYANNHDVEAAHRIDNELGLRPSKRIKTESSMTEHHAAAEIKKNDEPPFPPVHINQPQADDSGSVLTHAINSDLNSGSSLLSMVKTLQTPRPFLSEICPRRLDMGDSAVSHLSDPNAGFVEQSREAQSGTSDVAGEPSMEEEEELFTFFSVSGKTSEPGCSSPHGDDGVCISGTYTGLVHQQLRWKLSHISA